jgi:alkylhydroperoxidase/carboxymuconolactone decarboxylase family protein YurZ
LRREGHCFNCKRRGHVSTTYLDNKELSKKTKKIVRVASATSSSTKEKKKKKIRKARKKESSSKEELGRIETLDKDSNLGKK